MSDDVKKALELAKKFLQSAKQMSKQLNDANESFLKENSAGELAKQISEQQKVLDEITEEQRKILAETQKLESKRLEAVMKAQESLLEQLAKRQRAVIDATGALIREPKLAPTPRAYFNTQLRPMDEVAQEFSQKRVDKAPERLAVIVETLRAGQTELLKSTPTASLADLHDGEIILLHGHPWTTKYLDNLMTNIEKKGYSFVNPSDITE
jgi:peptidoglycan/xylan/chitin deacetylase (PgdA/CDA1 family)